MPEGLLTPGWRKTLLLRPGELVWKFPPSKQEGHPKCDCHMLGLFQLNEKSYATMNAEMTRNNTNLDDDDEEAAAAAAANYLQFDCKITF